VQIGIKKNLIPLHLQSTTASWDSLLSSLGEEGGKQYGAWASEYSFKTLRGLIKRHVTFAERV
jgi:hypothetical protein